MKYYKNDYGDIVNKMVSKSCSFISSFHSALIFEVFRQHSTQRTGLAAVLEFIMSSPELKPNRITDDEDKN